MLDEPGSETEFSGHCTQSVMELAPVRLKNELEWHLSHVVVLYASVYVPVSQGTHTKLGGSECVKWW